MGLLRWGSPGVVLIASDACRGLVESVAEYLPEALWQRCVVGPLKNSLPADSLMLRIDNERAVDVAATRARPAGVLRLRIASGSCPGRPCVGAGRTGSRSWLAA
ncbi:MAG: transposase [Pseudomonadota bacterium]